MVKSKLRGSLTYPAIVTVTAGVSIYILIEFSIPMLSGLLDEFDAEMPIITKIILALSGFAKTTFLYFIVGFVGIIAVSSLYRRRPAGKLKTDEILLRLPLMGGMVHQASIARITQTLASLLNSGIPLLEAVQLTRDNTENAVMSRSLEQVRLQLLSGTNFSDALAAQGSIYPPMLTEMMRIGETSGSLAEQLDVVSKIVQQDFDASISKMVGIIEPGMILLVGGIVGIIGVTVITTVYSILPAIGGE